MSTMQTTFYYKFYDNGFTEQWYLNNVNITPNQLNQYLQTFVGPAAMSFRHPACSMIGIRSRDVANTRNGNLLEVALGNNGSQAGANSPDIAALALRYGINGANGANRKIWLRGLNDSLTKRFSANGLTDASATDADVNRYLLAMKNNGAAIRKQIPLQPLTPASPFNWQVITQFNVHPTNSMWTQFKMNTNGAGPPQVGQTIYFRGLPNPTMLYLRGAFKVVEVNAETLTVTVPAQFRGTAAVPCSNCAFRRLEYTYEAIQTWGNAKLGKHDTGRPISTERGRRSPVIRRSLTRAG